LFHSRVEIQKNLEKPGQSLTERQLFRELKKQAEWEKKPGREKRLRNRVEGGRQRRGGLKKKGQGELKRGQRKRKKEGGRGASGRGEEGVAYRGEAKKKGSP